jgi:hypothetical protein
MLLDSQEFLPLDTREKITMADSFVVRANKLGDGNGEKKLYIGNEDPALRDFYGPRGFNNKCFLMRQDLIKFLHGLKVEYTSPQLPYKKKDELPSLYTTRLAKIQALPEIIWFSIQEQTQLEPPRVYVNSKDENYKIIRELSLPNLSYISILKLRSSRGDIVYYIRLFTDFMDSFGVTEHPVDIKNEEALVEYNSLLSKEEKLQTVKARVGQGKYRKQLLEQCPFCPITLVSDDRLLIASHIKPWAASEQAEKIDPKNGFMFTPTIDYLFDSGFITFEDNKKMVVSPWLSKPTISRLNIKPLKIIDQLPVAGREKYLSYHRENIFKA